MIKKIKKIIKFIVAWFKIPRGMYCYFDSRFNRCPYWRRIEGRPYQEDGWCDYMGKGDTEIIAEGGDWTVVHVGGSSSGKVGDKIEGFSLLWDQCKEYRIKDE